MPLFHWFRENPGPALLDILLEPRTLRRGYFAESGVRQLLKEHRNGVRDRSSELWQLLIFELWHRNFLETKSKQKPAAAFPPNVCVLEAVRGGKGQELARA